MQKGLLIFDLDGTLMDTRRDLSAAVNRVRRHYGLAPLPEEVITSYIGDGIRQLVARALQGQAVDLEQAVLLQARFYHQHLHDATTLYPGVASGLPQLQRAGYALAVVTNKPTAATLTLLEHFQLREFFFSVLGGDKAAILKPHPQPLRDTMRLAGVTADQAWMIGDHVTDLEAARRAGIRSAFVSYGIGRSGAEKPAATFTSFADLTLFFLNRLPQS